MTAGLANAVFYFPDVNDGACPGEDGHLPERIDLGRFAVTWTEVCRPREDGSWFCITYSRAIGSDPEDGLWLRVHDNHLRFSPGEPIPDDARAILEIDQNRFPMAIGDGDAFIPTSLGPVACALGSATGLTITVKSDSGVSQSHPFSLAGFVDAYAGTSAACGFNAANVVAAE